MKPKKMQSVIAWATVKATTGEMRQLMKTRALARAWAAMSPGRRVVRVRVTEAP